MPWKNVAQLLNGSNPVGSGVYLGNQYLLTANDVNSSVMIIIDCQSCIVDTTLHYGGFTSGAQQIDTADLKLLRLSSGPALVIPGLIDVNLSTSTTLDRNQDVTLIGYGQDRGIEVVAQGWNWTAGTEDQRWGTNTTLNSGSGMFFEHAGQWHLAGIGFTVDVRGSSFYDRDSMAMGEQLVRSFFVRISSYHSQINSGLSVIPEPGTMSLLGLSAMLLILWGNHATHNNPGRRFHPGVVKQMYLRQTPERAK